MFKLDEIDFNILEILQFDSRTSYREIQKELGISIGTIHNRIHKLIKNGIIDGFSILLNNQNLGYKLTILIRIDFDGKKLSEILQDLYQKHEICSIFHITGKDSLELICRFKDLKDIHNFISNLNKKEGIFKINSNMVLKEYKSSLNIEIGDNIAKKEN